MDDDLVSESEELSADQLRELQLLLGIPSDEAAIFASYIDAVANDGLLPYKATIHYSETAGGKAGESLYSHILNGIFVLEQLRRLLGLDDEESQVLFTAFTLHDINKMVEERAKYKRLATRETVSAKIAELKLDCFFPGYDAYIDDVLTLMKLHSAHQWDGAEFLDLRRSYRLDHERLRQLVFLMRAADGIDLSHSLDEQRHKQSFLVQLNSFSDTQYTFFTHGVTEQRGSFTNLVHNAVIDEIAERFGLRPLLIYPDGAAYLCPRGALPAVDDGITQAIAQRVAATISEMTSEGFRDFIRPINMGITVDPKCLDLNLPFATIFDAICAIIQKRVLKADKLQRLAEDSVKRTRKLLEKRATGPSADLVAIAAAEALLASGPVPQTQDSMRIGEQLRSYYIFLLEHFAGSVPAPWQRIYDLLDLPPERRAMLDCFEARMDRAYAAAIDLPLDEAVVIARIKRDGEMLMADRQSADPRLPILTTYLRHVLTFGGQNRAPSDFAESLPGYMRQQHKQCVQCSLPLPTRKWGSANVRSDIKVQLFSNRLGGGPGEPVKRVCGICEMQFLVEKLSYREIRGEQTAYLHLFPYSFQTAPFLDGLRTTLRRISRGDLLAGALRLNDIDRKMRDAAAGRPVDLLGSTRTKEGKAQPYGVYLPRYSATLAGMMTFPINPPSDDSDTQKFLFVLHHALLLQRHFGCKVLVSTSATPPLDKEAFGDVAFDLTPLNARGLVRLSDYSEYRPRSREPGTLRQLWHQLGWLLAIRAQLATRKSDPQADLVRAMADHPLRLFYAAEKLAEAKARDDGSVDTGWTLRSIADDVRMLALSIGGDEMGDLDEQLQRLAEIAWKGGLRGQSLEKNSLMAPLDEVLRKLGIQSQELPIAVLQAAAAQDLYEHIKRIRESSGKPYSPAALQAASEEFVRVFVEDVFGAIYHGKVARLLSHEKILRSAFHLYIRRQIPRKPVPPSTSAAPTPATPENSNDELFADAS